MHSPLREWIDLAGDGKVLDLASGGGGPIELILDHVSAAGAKLPVIVLSDMHPCVEKYEQLRSKYEDDSIDFVSVPNYAL